MLFHFLSSLFLYCFLTDSFSVFLKPIFLVPAEMPWQDLQYLTRTYKLLPIPLSLPSAHMHKCNCCVLPFLKKQKYPNGFNVDLMISSTVDAFKQSKARLLQFLHLLNKPLCAIADKTSMHYQYCRKQLGSCNSCYKDSIMEFAQDKFVLIGKQASHGTSSYPFKAAPSLIHHDDL